MQYFILIISLIFTLSIGYGKIKVCTTTSLIQDIVQQIAGEAVELQSLMGVGIDPHLYKATALDLRKLSDADLIFYNGLHLEGRMTEVFESLSNKGKAVFAVTDGIDRSSLLKIEGAEGYDPHVWFDPRLWAQCAHKVLIELQKKDPDNAKLYQSRWETFDLALKNIYIWGNQLAQSLPQSSKFLITSHDAYNYFGKAFGFQVIGVQGISTVSEAGLADIVSTVDFIKEHKIKSIFIESSVSPAAIERISKDSGARIGGKLFSDSLGNKGEMEGDYDVGNYLGMFKYNIITIINGLK